MSSPNSIQLAAHRGHPEAVISTSGCSVLPDPVVTESKFVLPAIIKSIPKLVSKTKSYVCHLLVSFQRPTNISSLKLPSKNKHEEEETRFGQVLYLYQLVHCVATKRKVMLNWLSKHGTKLVHHHPKT